MNREKWEFSYPVMSLHAAAVAKLEHHAARLKWWEDKKAEVTEKVKASGIEIDESQANLASNSYQRGATVQINTTLLRDLQESVEKIREHRNKSEIYDGWVQVLGAQHPSVGYPLHHDDWLFFFSAGSAPVVADEDK